MQRQPSKRFFKKALIRNFAEFKSKDVPESFFWIKLGSINLQLLLKRDFSEGVFLRILKIRKNTFFVEHHHTTASDYSSINSISIIVPWY